MLLEFYVRQILQEENFKKRSAAILSSSTGLTRDKIDSLIQGLSADINLKKDAYLTWGANQIKSAAAAGREENPDEIVELIKNFHNIKSGLGKSDISQYGSVEELDSAVGQRSEILAKKRKKSQTLKSLSQIREENFQKAYEESNFLISGDTPESLRADKLIVVNPMTRHASQYWSNPSYFSCDIEIAAGRTKWCTGATEGGNAFDDYMQRGSKLFYIIDKSKPVDSEYYKIAYACTVEFGEFNEFMTIDDFDEEEVNTEIFDSTDDPMTRDEVSLALGSQIFKIVERSILNFLSGKSDSKKTSEIQKVEMRIAQGDRETILKNIDNPRYARQLTDSPNLPQEAIDRMMSLDIYTKSEALLFNIASNPQVDRNTLLKIFEIIKSGSVLDDLAERKSISAAIILNKEITPEDVDYIIRNLSEDQMSRVSDALGASGLVVKKMLPKTQMYALNFMLNKSESYRYRSFLFNLFRSEDIPIQEVIKLYKMGGSFSGSKDILNRIAKDPTVSLDILEKIYKDSKEMVNPGDRVVVHSALASNPAISEELLRDLISQKNQYEKSRIVIPALSNPKFPSDLLKKFIIYYVTTGAESGMDSAGKIRVLTSVCENNTNASEEALKEIEDYAKFRMKNVGWEKEFTELAKVARKALERKGAKTEAALRSFIKSVLI